MADKRDLSVSEMLAYCRNADGEGGAVASPVEEDAAPAVTSEPAAPSAPVDASKMSVADMLAAARGEKAGGGSPAGSAASKPAAAAAPVDASKMSVADMLAAARGEKAAPVAKKSPAKKAAAKSSAGKAKPAAAKPSRSGPMDTSSILAAARGATKPGPISKSEAAAKAKSPAGKPAKEKPKAPPMPAKPEYARAVAAKSAPDSGRRGVLQILFGSSLAIGWGAMTATAGLASLVVARYFFPNLLIEPPSQFKVGFPGDFASDTVATKFKAQFGVWVVNAEYEGQQQIFALKSVCTHLGCTPNWLEAEQKFKCPCHGSGFYKDGVNFEGPAPRPLERYAIAVADDGQVAIDKSKTFQEQLGQWGDSSSYVSV